jgi:phage terminase large subunit-like protein
MGSITKRKNWMTFMISTNGVIRDAVFDKYSAQWDDILDGKLQDDSTQIWYYSLDSIEEVHDQTKWQKAMPLLGITQQKVDIQLLLDKAKDDPIRQIEILTKSFNLSVNNSVSYFTNDECKGNPEIFNKELFHGTDEKNAYAVIGLDCSDIADIFSIDIMIQDKGVFHFHTLAFTPRSTFDNLPSSKRQYYLRCESDGHFIIHDMPNNDRDWIFEYLASYLESQKIFPILLCCDPWRSAQFKKRFADYYNSPIFDVQQTVKTLSEPMQLYKTLIKSDNKKIAFDNKISIWCHSNVKAKVDANFNVFPNKASATDKIDAFISKLICLAGWEMKKDELHYYFD